MIKTTMAALGIMGMLAGTALAAPPPNAVGETGMGGGVYYNPSLPAQPAQPVRSSQNGAVGTTGEGASVYHAPVNSQHG